MLDGRDRKVWPYTGENKEKVLKMSLQIREEFEAQCNAVIPKRLV